MKISVKMAKKKKKTISENIRLINLSNSISVPW